MQTRELDYSHGETLLQAHVAWQETDQARPLVLVAHDWSGRRDLACEAAEYVAGLGYVGFALDIYGKGVFGKEGDAEVNGALMKPYAADRELLRGRMLAALEAGRALAEVDASRVAAMGFCFGGMSVLELARSGADVAGVVSIHGLLQPGDVATEAIRARVLCLHGHDDPMVSPEAVLAFEKEMSAAGADWQIHVYGGTLHAFTNPRADNPDFGTQYNPVAARRAYRALEDFFGECFEQD